MPSETIINQVVIWAVTAALGAICISIKQLAKKQREQADREEKRTDALCIGMRSLLRNELVKAHREYVVGRGSCPLVVKEIAERNYEAYHGLSGNGTGTSLYQDIMDLPIREE